MVMSRRAAWAEPSIISGFPVAGSRIFFLPGPGSAIFFFFLPVHLVGPVSPWAARHKRRVRGEGEASTGGIKKTRKISNDNGFMPKPPTPGLNPFEVCPSKHFAHVIADQER